MTSPTPLAHQPTLDVAVAFCKRELSRYGLKSIYLIGSRANGQPRPNSDHDLLVVVGDEAPREVGTGQSLGIKLFEDFCRELRCAGVGPVDLIIQREAHHLASKNDKGSFANATLVGGIKIL